MKDHVKKILDELLARFDCLRGCEKEIVTAYQLMEECYTHGGKVLICGNGGSQADADHIVGELMKGFLLKRPVSREYATQLGRDFEDGAYLAANLQGALPAISLGNHNALLTAFSNDVAPDMGFAQQVFGYGKKGDVLIGLTTSGNSGNVVNAAKIAKSLGVSVVSITGAGGGKIAALSDSAIQLPATETYLVQELTLPVYHALCAMIETHFFACS
ncbi:SIS domain-containing protein [Hydrogenoanaerobacterium sp.]|uniref:D-sedoheptulose-7-phosphate isomerase n=1 Tax=Hydrogenoanaerobacterium sp. TaxID=2953763 RepID=UPI00289A72DB|nr:SIS domain-containing protein [Hydrogenoanaerobacterium sp.]